ncbi:nucleotidyltransferase family protein [Winogradskyella psychrotolerans]|uniref:nucleotidyltransferase family protein n=1 Tax=Winogradskyella psychrotolerans TaxID=1344585 RepID=UPI001C070983|nr:nucleotidyltransferase family protein [Winogradskyella psychrotolerans]MBU2927597.1 nucleotidyltransferase family protein [Winogradskyella psychrotolerans]
MNIIQLTHLHIAAILSFETSKEALETTINDPKFDWDIMVIEASKHLVLPTLYCRLKAKELLHILPKDLVVYLKEITTINRQRNLRLLQQVNSITHILNKHNISHVFLKGSALLASGHYLDKGERMIGDIDILIEKKDLSKTFDILKNSGYSKTIGFAYTEKDHRHLDRLISDQELAAIELHSDLFHKKNRSILTMDNILKSKRIINNIAIPNTKYFSLHIMLNWQLNDRGHYYNTISLKSIYDFIILNSDKSQESIKSIMSLKYGQSYLALASYYFQDYSNITCNRYMSYRIGIHKLLSKYKWLNILVYFLKYNTNYIGNRLYLIATNKSYRKHLIQKKIKLIR